MIYFSQLSKITGGHNARLSNDGLVESIFIDSRKASSGSGALFFAIKGERHDGHTYLSDLYARGVRQFVIEQPMGLSIDFPEANILLVDSSVDALQKIAAFSRQHFSYPVVGITGSNGKTITKEWLYQMLSVDHIVVKNPGSFNSQVGVPLSIWQMQPHHQLGVFEAGISKRGEMEKLERVIRPTIGILTNIGSAHSEGFLSQEEKAEEKLKLFKNSKIVIYCADHNIVGKAVEKTGIKTFSWGIATDADLKISVQQNIVYIEHSGNEYILKLPFADKASIENCMHCVAVMIYLGYPLKKIQRGVTNLRSVSMRMEMKEAINQSYLIDDTYNNDLGGLELSLQFLTHQKQKKNKRLILSDILESGLPEDVLAQQIVLLLQKHDVQLFVGIGPLLTKFRTMFPPSSSFFSSTEDFLANFDFTSVYEEVILVKGARVFTFEKIVQRLQRKVHGTVMEIDLSALVHNLNFFKSRLKPHTKVMVMVKAFAYGSGSPEVANVLQYHRVDYLGVAYADEGIDLRKNNIALPIMVMNPSEDSFDSIVAYNLEPEIYNFKIFHALLQYLNGRTCAVHIKLDTGMHRLGFEQKDLPELIRVLLLHPNIRVASVFSHLAGADDSQHDNFSNKQANLFEAEAAKVSDALSYKPLYHILNSSGILRLSHLQYDMVRLGIGLYGVDPTHENFQDLKPVATLKTIISQIKQIAQGESIGYGRSGVAESDMTLATIAIGYADGFNRGLGRGVGEVLIGGKRARTMGNVCMDMTMVDITGINAREGDEVIVFGDQLPVQSIAERLHTIPYEILTNVSERVKRVFLSDGI